MELWILSQDRAALTKVNIGVMYFEENKRKCIANRDSAVGMSILGEYKTKERTMEVLKEIKDQLENMNKTLITDNGFKYYSNVYEMPIE